MTRPSWPSASELRIGLGCMRLSTDETADENVGLETIAAAAEAGITVFDTARAYGDNESLLAEALRGGAHAGARIVTKGGMTRSGGRWVPDGRAKALRSDCEASLAALDGLAIDLYLIHAPDPRTPWRTSVRALARLADEGLVRHVGIANVNRRQLDEALELAPISAVQVALSPFDDHAVRGGVVDRCAEAGIAVIAHSPLGGTRRVGRLARIPELTDVAQARGATPAEVALAWLLDLSPAVVAIPGARRPETARSAARAATIALGENGRTALARAFGQPRPARVERRQHIDGGARQRVLLAHNKAWPVPPEGGHRALPRREGHGSLLVSESRKSQGRDEEGGQRGSSHHRHPDAVSLPPPGSWRLSHGRRAHP